MRSTQAVNTPAVAPRTKKGASGRTSRRHDNRPRCHQKITSSAAGKVAVTVLLKQPQHKQPERPQIQRPLPRLVEAEVDHRGRQVEHAGKGVLQLRDPGHRLHLHRMQGEDGRRQVRPGDRQPPQDQGHHQGRQGVQPNVHQVVAERRVAPQLVLDPEGAVQQRVILLRGPEVEPDPVQSLPGTQFGAGYVRLVVPDESALPGRLINQEHRDHQGGRKEPVLRPESLSKDGTPFGRSWGRPLARSETGLRRLVLL